MLIHIYRNFWLDSHNAKAQLNLRQMKGTFFSVEILNRLATENCDKMFLRYIIKKEKPQNLDDVSKFPQIIIR